MYVYACCLCSPLYGSFLASSERTNKRNQTDLSRAGARRNINREIEGGIISGIMAERKMC